jgi:hypothetical protein
MEIKKEKFLNIEEADNLQDMINFAASIKDNENLNGNGNGNRNGNLSTKNKEEDINAIYPVESLYSKVMSNENVTNKELDKDIVEVLNE